MSEINFEALGRCQHLKALVLELRRERDRTFNRIKHSYITPSQDTAEAVHHFETGGLRVACDKLDQLNTECVFRPKPTIDSDLIRSHFPI